MGQSKKQIGLINELKTYFQKLQILKNKNKDIIKYLPKELKGAVVEATSIIKTNKKVLTPQNEDSNYYLQKLINIAEQLLVIVPNVELIISRFPKSNQFLKEEIELIKKCYSLIEGGGLNSYFGIMSNNAKCRLTHTELSSFKKNFPSIEKEIYKVYPLITVIKEKAEEANQVSILTQMEKNIDGVQKIIEEEYTITFNDNNKEMSYSQQQLFIKYQFYVETIQKIIEKNLSLKNNLSLINISSCMDWVEKIKKVLSKYTILYGAPVDDNQSNTDDVTEDLNAYKATLDINIFGGVKTNKGIRSFNYKGGDSSSVKLPLSIEDGEIELIIDFSLSEKHFSGTGYHKGQAKLYVDYSTTSYGKIELKEGKPASIDLKKNNSWSKLTSLQAYVDKKNNIYIVIALTKHGESSSTGLSVGVKVNEDVSVTGSYANSWTETKGVATQKVFTLKLDTEETKTPVIENSTKLEFDNNSAIIRSEDIHILVDWWEKIGKASREKITSQDAEIYVTGYASPEGTEYYNIELADDRAKEIAKKLHTIIGEKSSIDNPNFKKASIYTQARGECTDDPRRYVTIEIK